MKLDRELLAESFIRGRGVEIGALHMPLRVPRSAKVKYVDRLSVDDLRKHYPELNDKNIVNVDIIANGEQLETIDDSTQDFVIANHFIEHCQNPVGALINMFRVLKPGGVLYLAIPDKRYSFDVDRPRTPLAHLMRDYREGPEWSRRQHFEEWTRLVNKVRDDQAAEEEIARNMSRDYSIHYHVWTQADMMELIVAMRQMVSFDVELFLRHEAEAIFILRKGYEEQGGAEEFRRMLDQVLTPEPWYVEDVKFDGEILEISGWALPPGGQHSKVAFMVNDQLFEQVEYPMSRPDVGEVFWFKPGSDKAAFRCRTHITGDKFFQNGYATLKCVDRETHMPVRQEFNWYYPDDSGAPPLPDPERRRRDAGNESAEVFRLEGHSTFKKLDMALRKVGQEGFGQFQNILDWGCGCGRTARNFYRLPNIKLTGVDADWDNLNWCKSHLSFGEFHATPLHPPTTLESGSFDLLFGISILSQLPEARQCEWLQELYRIARPGAFLLMSVLGEASACQVKLDAERWKEWHKTGILSLRNVDRQGYIDDDDFCGNTYMTGDYIRRTWSNYFRVVEIIPAYIGNQQDLIILHKPE
ncbi:MAG: methyltransferase domain-containing protein [Blastocatellia bacterium]